MQTATLVEVFNYCLAGKHFKSIWTLFSFKTFVMMHSPLGLLSTTGRYPMSHYNDTLKLIYFWVFVTHTLSAKPGSSAPFHQCFGKKRLCYGGRKKNLLKCNSLIKMHLTTVLYFYKMHCPLDTCAGKCWFALKQLSEISWQILVCQLLPRILCRQTWSRLNRH